MNHNMFQKLLLAVSLGVACGATIANAATAVLKANDASGTTSFTATTNWSFTGVPDTFTNYFTSTNQLRTPATATDTAFPGTSLTLQAKLPGDANGSILEKSSVAPGAMRTLTINNLTNAAGAVIRSGGTPGGIIGIAGNIFDIAGNSTLKADQCAWVIKSPMVGAEGVVLTNIITTNSGSFENHITFTNDNSGYKGKLVISSVGVANISAAVYFATTTSALGNPSVLTPDQITLGANGFLRDEVGLTLGANSGITLAANGSIFSDAIGSNTVIPGPITDNGSGFSLTKRGGGILTLSGNNTFSGGLTLFGATAGSQLNINSPGALGTGIFTINSGAGAAVDNTSGSALTLTNNNPQSWANSFAFLGSSSLDMGGAGVTLTAGVTITVSNNDLTVGAVTDNSGGYALTKAGPGTLTLNGGGSYSGATTVSGGTLAITGGGSLSSSPSITIASNAVLDMSAVGGLSLNPNQILASAGGIIGSVTDNSSTILYPGGSGTFGTLTVNGDLTLNGGGGVSFDLTGNTTPGGGTNDLVVVTGTLDLAGPTTAIQINGIPVAGTYTLFQYGALSGSLANLSVPVGYALNNNTTAKTIELVVTHVPASLTWVGDGSANIWDLGTTPNWSEGTSNVDFFTGDSVTFTDTGSAAPPVNLTGTISPTATIINSTQTYDFTGAGITSGSLTKSGTGTLILENSNSYAGPTVINAGTVQLGNGGTPGAFGTGPVTNNGAIAVNSSGTAILSQTISGTGSLALQAGSATLSASNSYSGATTISSGTLFLQNGSGLGATNGGTTVASGGQLYINGAISIGAEPLTLNGAGGDGSGALRKNGGNAATFGGVITLASDTTFKVDGSGTLNLTNAAGINGSAVNANLTLNGDGSSLGSISGPLLLGTGALNINSSGTWTLGAPGVFSGGTTLSGGVVNANTNGVFGAGTVMVNGVGRIVLGSGVNFTNFLVASTVSPGVSTGLLMVNDNTNGTVTTISAPLEFDATPANGGDFYGPTTSGYLNVTGPVTNTATGVVTSRNGFVRFSGGGSYTAFTLNQGTASIGANNGLCTNAAVAMSVSAASVFDLNGFNQALTGLTDGAANAELVTNSSATPGVLTLNLSGGDTYGGILGGNLALVVNGPGSLYLTNNNTYSGNTTVTSGTLELAQPCLSPKSTVTLANGAVLQLDFATTNQVFGLVLGGVSQPAGIYNSTTSSGFISGSGSLAVQPGPSGPGYLTNSYSAGILSLTWPAGQGWRLQTQTNSLSAGLGTNWVYATDGSVSSTNIVTGPGVPSVFYRLVYP